MKFMLALFLFFTVLSSSRSEIVITDKNATLSAREEKFLFETTQKAELFYKSLSGFEHDIQIAISPGECLRTGYNYVKRVIQYCPKTTVERMGVTSFDVITHETFHFLFCHQFPQHCLVDQLSELHTSALHEGFADYFSYLLSPDEFFGESFYLDAPYIRAYRNDYCSYLMNSAHELGNILVNNLIEAETSPAQLFSLMESFDYDFKDNCPELNQVIPITLLDGTSVKRKWLQKGESVTLKFQLDQEYHFSLLREKELLEISIEDQMIMIKGEEKGFEKLTFVFYKGPSLIGAQKIYIGQR